MLGMFLCLLPPQDPGIEFFEANVRPLFATHCTKCHGEEKQEAELRLDRFGSILRGGEGGTVIVPGDLDASRLIMAVRYGEEHLQMPPRNRLPKKAIATLEQWVSMGAPGPVDEGAGGIAAQEFDLAKRLEHWAYQAVADPAVPEFPGDEWGRDSLDAYVGSRLLEAGLEPAPEVDRATWLRRVSYGTIGLPPTPLEREAFLGDASPQAYERVMERLLASPHYGEKWARHWLDLVRYADSRGHEFDVIIPGAFEYRDYVTRALNADVPYDRFVLEHIAGDLLDEPRTHPVEEFDESVLGTGFWYLGEEVHSPVDIREDETHRISNQIDVFTRTFLATTIACARCHDHKFDPVVTEDYYAFAGFLHSSSFRQVLFPTLHHNTSVAGELAALDREMGPRTRRVFAEALAVAVPKIESYLLATQAVVQFEAHSASLEEVPVEGLDLLFEDFEGSTWGAWTTTGTAFGPAPVDRAGVPGYHPIQAWRGERFVCTSRTSHGEDGNVIDAQVGRLQSPTFVIRHDYLHFLACGGNHKDKTAINLVVGDRVVRTSTGANTAHFRPVLFDISEWRGEKAHIEVIDEWGPGWGNIAVDQFVFSDEDDPRALDRAYSPEECRALLLAVDEVARTRQLDVDALREWTLEVLAARRDPGHPLHHWSKFCHAEGAPTAGEPGESTAGAGVRVLCDYGGGEGPAPWLQDGNLFGPGPVGLGAPQFGADPFWPIDGVRDRAAAQVDAAWARAEFGFGIPDFVGASMRGGPSGIDWVQAGRTLRTPSFVPEHGRIHYLVRGAGRCFASIHSHRNISGPLHQASIKKFEGDGDWRWVTHELGAYAGHRIHLEFTPVDGSTAFAVARVVEARQAPAPASGATDLVAGFAGHSFAENFGEACARGVRSLGEGTFQGEDGGREQAALLDWLVRRPALLPGVDRDAVASAASPHLKRRNELLASVRTATRSAPAMLDGTAFDERVFIRGDYRTLGPITPRRLPLMLSGSDPIDSVGSGRLELGHRLTDPANPLLARVIVNRTWHHLFGRGIVASVDDFGKQGDVPTHPELLDHLTTRFMRDGWSIKQLVRAITLSATYRQATVGDPRAALIDPDNRLLGRSSVRRLEAEAIRDGALAVSGSLDRKLYGPSVPVYLTEFMEGRGRPPASGPIDGGNRRSLYLAVPRNFLSPMLRVFDCPIPSSTQGRRNASNVPAQSLTLMNDPFFQLLADRWGQRAIEFGAEDRAQVIEELFVEAFSRAPRAAEIERILAFLGDRNDEGAWSDVCHVLLNMKEFIFIN